MSVFAIVGFCIIAAVLSAVLRQHKPEFGMYISLAAGVAVFGLVLNAAAPVIDNITGLANAAGSEGKFAGTLLKALAVCYVTAAASDTCKDAGETAIAAKIDVAGRVAVVLISLPLWEELVNIVAALL